MFPKVVQVIPEKIFDTNRKVFSGTGVPKKARASGGNRRLRKPLLLCAGGKTPLLEKMGRCAWD